MAQRKHHRGGLTNLAPILERVLNIREGSLGIAEHPQSF